MDAMMCLQFDFYSSEVKIYQNCDIFFDFVSKNEHDFFLTWKQTLILVEVEKLIVLILFVMTNYTHYCIIQIFSL